VPNSKQQLSRVLPTGLRSGLRRAGRLRWIAKARILRRYGPGTWKGKPLRQARYVLFDPEVDSFTYALANLDELAATLARLLGCAQAEARAHLEEARTDPTFGEQLSRDIGWRAVSVKRRPQLPSHHLSAWVIVRVRKPALTVETGILNGLGSRTILRALERNAAEGSPGRLVSFDVVEGSGKTLVPDGMRAAWTPVYEGTPEALAPQLAGTPIDFFIHDSVQSHEHLVAEVEAALPLLAPKAILMTTVGWSTYLEERSAELGAEFEGFAEQPADHFYPGRTLAWLRLP